MNFKTDLTCPQCRAMGAAVWEIDVRSDVMSASARWAEILGYEPGRFALTAEMHRALLHPDDSPRVVEAFRAHLSSPAPLDIEYRMQRRQGGYAWVHVRGRLQDDRRKIIGTAVDVTERRATCAAFAFSGRGRSSGRRNERRRVTSAARTAAA